MDTSEVVEQYETPYGDIAIGDTFVYSTKLYLKYQTASPQLFNLTDNATAADSALGPTTIVLKRDVKVAPS